MKQLHSTRVLCSSSPLEAESLSVLQNHPDGMILTVTKAVAATISRITVNNHFFPDMQPCRDVRFDNADTLDPIYQRTRVILTQNRNKEFHVVNGQPATVVTMQNHTF